MCDKLSIERKRGKESNFFFIFTFLIFQKSTLKYIITIKKNIVADHKVKKKYEKFEKNTIFQKKV